MQSCENLKAGDAVFVCGRFGRSLCRVEKITPKGFIKVAGTLYTKAGFQRGSDGWDFTSIRPASAEEIEQYRKEKFIADVVKKLRFVSNLQYEQAVAINRILFEEGKDDEQCG